MHYVGGARRLCIMASRTSSCPAPRLVAAVPVICRQPPITAAQCKSLCRRNCTSGRRQRSCTGFSRQSQLAVTAVLHNTARPQRTPKNADIKSDQHNINGIATQQVPGDGAEREPLDPLQPGLPVTVRSRAQSDLPVLRPVQIGSSATQHKSRHQGSSSTFFSSSSWQQLGASADVVTSLASLGLHRPSHVQAEAFRALSPTAASKHVVIADQAGSGKTLAYLVPLLQRYKAKESSADSNAPKANCPSLVVLAPTTELAQQVGRVVRALSNAGLRVRTAVMTGGQGEADRRSRTFRTQCEQLAGGVDVLVATPGRLLAHLEKGSLQLDETLAVVLDEIDILAGTESTYSEYVAPLRAAAPPSTQFVLVSATLPQHTFDQLQELFPGLDVAFGPGLHHTATGCIEELVDCSGGESISLESGTKRKLDALAESLKRVRSTRVMVFCNKIDTCRVVENTLKRQGDAGQVLAFHEAVREDLRNAALSSWLTPPHPEELPKILVCTDRMSRGIDSMWCEHVVLFEFPRDPSEYVRRVGRTARGAGGRGVVTVLVLGKQVALAKEIMDRNRSGAPVHKVPRLWTS